MGTAIPMVNVRMPSHQISAVDGAAERDDLNRSTWCREVLTAACRSGLPLEKITELLHAEHPRTSHTHSPSVSVPKAITRRSLGPRRINTGACLHPIHLVRRYPTRSVCACGTVTAHHGHAH